MAKPTRSDRLAALLRRRNESLDIEPDLEPEPDLESELDLEPEPETDGEPGAWTDEDPLPPRPGHSKRKTQSKKRVETPQQREKRIYRNREYMRKVRAQRKRAGIMALEAGCPKDVPDDLKTNTLSMLRRVNFVNLPVYGTAEEVWAAALDYFAWNDAHPLVTMKTTHHQGSPLKLKGVQLRAMSINALSTHMGISARTWRAYRERSHLVDVCEMVEQVIYTQKFESAAGDMLNSVIIVRELGLKDQSEVIARSPVTALKWSIIPRGEQAYDDPSD